VLHAPARNPPFSKKSSHHFHFVTYFLAGTMDLKKNENLEFFKKVLNSGTLARKLFK